MSGEPPTRNRRNATADRVAALVAQSGGAVKVAAALGTSGPALVRRNVVPSDGFAVDTSTGEMFAAEGVDAPQHLEVPGEPELAAESPAIGALADLAATAQRLRRVLAAAPQQHRTSGRPARNLRDADVAALLGGEVFDDGVVVVDRSVPARVRRLGPRNLAPLARRGVVIDDSCYDDLVYLDTETTGLSGGTGTVVFVLGLARQRGATIDVRQFVLTGFVGEPALLAGAHDWLESASGLVTYNGLSFDVPLLLTRFRLARLPKRHAVALTSLPHLDLLHPMRAAFARQWPNCTLQMAEKKLLNHHRVDDLPGAMVPQVFTDLVRYGLTDKLDPAVAHNRDDLVGLSALVDILGGVYAGNGEGTPGGVARRLIRHGDHQRALDIMLAADVTYDDRDAELLARLERRAERLQRQREREATRANVTPSVAGAKRRRARVAS